MTWLDHFACALVDQAAIQSVESEGSGPVRVDDAVELRRHLARVLAIVTRTGGYMTAEDQEVIRAARRRCGSGVSEPTQPLAER